MKKEDVTRNWYLIDADGQVLGRMAARIATMLQGKHKPVYTPHVDTGDYIVVINAAKVVLKASNKDEKMYHHHSGYAGGLKSIPFERMIQEKPEDVVKLAVRGMLPKSKLGKQMLKKLKVYGGSEHDHAAQKPEVLELNA